MMKKFVVSLFLGWISFYASSAFSTDSGKRAETTEISATCETGMSGSRDFYRLPEEQDVRRQSLPTKQNTMMDTKKIDKWAELLLDTGKRNNLINFKDTRVSTVEVLLRALKRE